MLFQEGVTEVEAPWINLEISISAVNLVALTFTLLILKVTDHDEQKIVIGFNLF